jgi:hypothetical protein
MSTELVTTRKLGKLFTMVNQNEALDVKMLFDWEGLYIVDLSLYPYQVGVVVDYEFRPLIDERECPRLTLKKRLLKDAGWELIELR